MQKIRLNNRTFAENQYNKWGIKAQIVYKKDPGIKSDHRLLKTHTSPV